MSWFTKTNKQEIQRKLERLLNKTVSVTSLVEIDEDVDERFDDRSERLTPVILLRLVEGEEAPQITTGVTKDMSIEGLGVTTLGKLEAGSRYAVGLGQGEEFSVFECRCVRSDPLGFGYFANGLAATDLLSTVDFVSLKEFGDYLAAHPPAAALPVAPTLS